MERLRLQKLRSAMAEQGISACLITNAHNRRYLTGFTGSSGTVLISADQAVLLTDFRYMSQATEQAKAFEVVKHGKDLMDAIISKVQEWGVRELHFEGEDMVYAKYSTYSDSLREVGVKFTMLDSLVEKLRMIKQPNELKVMENAAKLADQTYLHIINIVKPGMTEKDVALELEFYMRHHGATSSSFDTIVASGERSALPHGVASDRVIQVGEFVKLDFGAYYQGYCSDITRTIVVGQPQEKHREIYEIVLEAQMHTLEHIKPGMSGQEADALARDVISRYGYGQQFGHSTGHGLGLEIHEAPTLSPTSDTILEPGMTVTVEPGIYLPEFGGVRIEDDIVMTETGAKRLTKSSKDLVIIN